MQAERSLSSKLETSRTIKEELRHSQLVGLIVAILLTVLFFTTTWLVVQLVLRNATINELQALARDMAEQTLLATSQSEQLEAELVFYEYQSKRLAGLASSQNVKPTYSYQHQRNNQASRAELARDGKTLFDSGIMMVSGRKLQPVGEWELTAYNPTVGQCDSDPWTTASGARTKPGITCAIDRRYWSFGTRFWVAGYGEVTAEDTGSKVKGQNRMDICVGDIRLARLLGRWKAAVYVIIE